MAACIYSISETAKRVQAAHRLTCDFSVDLHRRLALEALITEIDGEQVRDFIMGNPRPALERAFEDELWKAGFKDAFCKVAGEAVEITVDFEAQPPASLHYLAVFIRGIAGKLRPEQSCCTILSVRRGNHVVVRFKFEPRRSGWEQFSRYREHKAEAEHGSAG